MAMEVNPTSKQTIIDNETQREKVEEQLWSWGAGTDGQLGTLRLQDEHLPQLLNVPSLSSASSVSMLACGGAHVVGLTSGGKVLTWGRGNSGQLGHGDMDCLLSPKIVMSLESYCITQVSAGWSHSGFVSDGSGNLLYGFGSGKRGQLGISIDRIKSVNAPEIIRGFDDVQIITITANADHNAALSADGELYTWGRGFGATSDFLSPQQSPSSLKFSKVALGWNHALVLSDNGEVFMLGGCHHGMLSNPEITTLSKHLSDGAVLERVPGLDGIKVVDIAAGAEHSAIVTEEGVIKIWGWGEHGQLGLGSSRDESSPKTVSLGVEVERKNGTVRVYCGSGYTYAISTFCS
ncbi:hypothetical protein ES319_A05G338100v1 [Gossypium barbadense]|uniref:Uncharacterized protein n=1 Tax=Gossypium barbadense TaxID=3634 RepID=A0A5J5VXY9_GOSBA|nr:hypothetical protein ES319_A05G338100v1 [Gossypium barbadense]